MLRILGQDIMIFLQQSLICLHMLPQVKDDRLFMLNFHYFIEEAAMLIFFLIIDFIIIALHNQLFDLHFIHRFQLEFFQLFGYKTIIFSEV